MQPQGGLPGGPRVAAATDPGDAPVRAHAQYNSDPPRPDVLQVQPDHGVVAGLVAPLDRLDGAVVEAEPAEFAHHFARPLLLFAPQPVVLLPDGGKAPDDPHCKLPPWIKVKTERGRACTPAPLTRRR